MNITTFTTSQDLLEQLQDRENTRIWRGFYYRYHPVLVGYGRRMGMSTMDAQDMAQDALMSFVKAFREGQFNPAKGRLRTWLMSIATNKIREFFRRLARKQPENGRIVGEEAAEWVQDPETMTRYWESEWKKAILKACFEEVKAEMTPRNMAVFTLIVQDQCSPAEVADKLEMTVEAVYRVKNRVVTRMREIREHLEKEW